MKKYLKPQIEEEIVELTDVIAESQDEGEREAHEAQPHMFNFGNK